MPEIRPAASPGEESRYVIAFLWGWALAFGGASGHLEIRQEVVSFPTQDGGVVFGDLYGEGTRGVILVPGGRFARDSWADQAHVLASAGFRVLAIELRGRGSSRAGPRADDDDMHFDVLAAVEYLRQREVASVSVVGASLGGWAAANASTRDGAGIDRLVLLAAPPIDEPGRLSGRKLFIATRDDVRGEGVRRLPDMLEQFARAPEPKELVVLDGSAHAQRIFDTDQGDRLLAEILRFLSS